MIGAFVYEVGYTDEFKTLQSFYDDSIWSYYSFRIPVMLGTATIFILPLNLLKDVTKLRFTSIFGIFSLSLVAIVIIVQLPKYIAHYDDTVKINWYDVGTGFTSDLNFFKGTATIFYAYNCHVGTYPVFDKLIDNTQKRMNKVLMRSIILDGSFYIIVGITGYLTQPINTPAFIIEREAIGKDYIMTVARWLVVILLLAKIPANYNVLRFSLFELIFSSTEIDTKR